MPNNFYWLESDHHIAVNLESPDYILRDHVRRLEKLVEMAMRDIEVIQERITHEETTPATKR